MFLKHVLACIVRFVHKTERNCNCLCNFKYNYTNVNIISIIRIVLFSSNFIIVLCRLEYLQ